ncbi:MAG: GntR family transcriptional regulator [Actinobacteria bacterium]|nr:GntR family transcriptional regulator [Actinomycetota bacterium]
MTTPTLAIHQPEAADATSLSDQAYYRIRELIVTLGLPPGSLVSERELMERLGVGRTPVREALRALARERLVEVYPRRGMFVSSIDVRDLAGLSEVRLTLEPRAARLAAERATDVDRERIEILLKELDHVRDTPDERALIDLDQRIHRHIYECTHNPFLAATLNEYYVLTLRIWFLALDRVARLEDAVREHRELLLSIKSGDGARAGEAMRRHVTGFEDAIRRVL